MGNGASRFEKKTSRQLGQVMGNGPSRFESKSVHATRSTLPTKHFDFRLSPFVQSASGRQPNPKGPKGEQSERKLQSLTGPH